MTTFEARLASHAATTDAFLGRVLDDRVDDAGVPERLRQAMRHAVMAGGKRFRPFLVIEVSSLFGVSTRQATATAGALECLHCYSLVHDDLPAMDNDRLRRGQPTVWAAFDDWTAILAGDALLTLSFEILSRSETHANPTVRNELVSALAIAGGPVGMVGGQALDLSSDKLGDPANPTLDYVRRLQAMKTGALIRFACEAGALLGQASDQERLALKSYGAHLGVVFQIADDLLDATGDAATVGKATGKDAAAGKATQVSLLGVEAAKDYLATMVQAALDDLAPFGERGAILAQAVHFAAQRAK
ncbi:MAG: farnesyl diphosphate synthase [Hyphomicrobiaceae bacterium]|jgi:farnesyl diphosphate synthase